VACSGVTFTFTSVLSERRCMFLYFKLIVIAKYVFMLYLNYKCKHLQAQRSALIKHIMIRRGDWPPAHDEMVTTYLNAFTRLIKSIDFQKL